MSSPTRGDTSAAAASFSPHSIGWVPPRPRPPTASPAATSPSHITAGPWPHSPSAATDHTAVPRPSSRAPPPGPDRRDEAPQRHQQRPHPHGRRRRRGRHRRRDERVGGLPGQVGQDPGQQDPGGAAAVLRRPHAGGPGLVVGEHQARQVERPPGRQAPGRVRRAADVVDGTSVVGRGPQVQGEEQQPKPGRGGSRAEQPPRAQAQNVVTTTVEPGTSSVPADGSWLTTRSKMPEPRRSTTKPRPSSSATASG